MLIIMPSMVFHVVIVMRIIIIGRIVAMVTIVMIVHIRLHIRLIMTDIHRFRILVVRREIAIVISRNPRCVPYLIQVSPYRRTFNPNRTNDILCAIDIRIAYDLYVQVCWACLCIQRCDILEDIRSQTSLNQIDVPISLNRLQYTQIIHISVTVHVQIVDHVTRRVEQFFELTYSGRLCKGGCYCLQVKIIRQIGRECIYLNCRGVSRIGCRSRNLTDCCDRLGRTDIYCLSRSCRYDTHRETSRQSENKDGQNGDL